MIAQPLDSTGYKAAPPANKSSEPADDLDSVYTKLLKELANKELIAQTKALDCLIRKKRLDMDLRAREEARKSNQAKALEICLNDAKRFPEVQELFQNAFQALRKAMEA